MDQEPVAVEGNLRDTGAAAVPNPQATVGGLCQSLEAVIRKAVLDAEFFPLVSSQAKQASAATDPEAALAVQQKTVKRGSRFITRWFSVFKVRTAISSRPPIQSATRRQPQAAVSIKREMENVIVCKSGFFPVDFGRFRVGIDSRQHAGGTPNPKCSVARGKNMIDRHRLPAQVPTVPSRWDPRLPGFQIVKSEIVAGPQSSMGVANNGPHIRVAQAFRLGIGFPVSVSLPSSKSGTGNADPQRAFAVLKYRSDGVGCKSTILAHQIPASFHAAGQAQVGRNQQCPLPVDKERRERVGIGQIASAVLESRRAFLKNKK